MSHTEAQARELWCPMVRIARREYAEPGPYIGEGETSMIVGGCNTDALGRVRVPASCRCIASECAMWRYSQNVFRCIDGSLAVHGGGVPTGYCGLAGRLGVVA